LFLRGKAKDELSLKKSIADATSRQILQREFQSLAFSFDGKMKVLSKIHEPIYPMHYRRKNIILFIKCKILCIPMVFKLRTAALKEIAKMVN